MKKIIPVKILDVQVHPVRILDLHEIIIDIITTEQKALILHVNVHGLNLANEQNWLRDFYNSATLVFCDGAGVILGARILGYKIPERITYADWMWQLGALAEENGFSLFLLGGKPGVAEKAAAEMVRKYTDLRISGTQHGYFDKQVNSCENQQVVANINQVNPNILVVAFGMPLQEQWLLENWNTVNANIALTSGAALDYVSGTVPRAPRWMTDNSLEWLGRLLIEPGRLWQRYLIGNPKFIYRVLLQKFGQLRL